MNIKNKRHLLNILCPDEIWKLSDVAKSVLRYYISCLPKEKVTEDETRYPQNRAGMRAFLIKFFSRHYLQVQNSLIDYISSNDFIDIINRGQIKILDIGSGPAVASLAITDIVRVLIEYLQSIGGFSKNGKIEIDYILNDTSFICLGIGRDMLRNYFVRRCNKSLFNKHLFTVDKPFPANINQIERIKSNVGAYDLVICSYVLLPLIDDNKIKNVVRGLLDVESLCSSKGRFLILQDKYQKSLIQQISRAIGMSSKKEESHQYIFPKRNDNETYNYSYYSFLYPPKDRLVDS
ncbi:MAG: hypothetical protein JW715_15635 [Sedimentisphaerales bacterium]|nr:hypothetical protein [Sedimentisphaerales bacterium]